MTPGHDPRPLLAPLAGGLCLLWFLTGLALSDARRVPPFDYLSGRRPAVLVSAGALTGPAVAAGEWWRLATGLFVHGGAVHLLCNLYALAAIAPAAEDVWGRRRAAVVFAVGGLAGACAGVGLRPAAVTCGASGAVCGLLAAIVVWLALYRKTLDPADARRAVRRVGFTVLVVVGVTLLPGVSWEGHLAGAVGGALAALLLNRHRWLPTVGLVAGCLGGLLTAVVYAPHWRPVCRAVAAARLAPLHPTRVNGLARSGQEAALFARRPATLTARATRLAADARAAGAGWVPAPELVRIRAYARAVGELAEAVAADPINTDAVRTKQRAADEAWTALSG